MAKASKSAYPNIRKEWIRQCGALYDIHERRMFRFLSDSENKKVRVGFGCVIDMSVTRPLVSTSIRYAEVVTDKLSGEALEDGQEQLPMEGADGWEPRGEPSNGTLGGEPPTTVTGTAEPEKKTRKRRSAGKEAASGEKAD